MGEFGDRKSIPINRKDSVVMTLSFPVSQNLLLLDVRINLYRYDHRHDRRGVLVHISSGKAIILKVVHRIIILEFHAIE
jgi:hypothetical protein